MNTDQCPYCGADTADQATCPECGRVLADAETTDPFAAAMAQERHSKEMQAAMREKYRAELPEEPAPERTFPAADESAAEKEAADPGTTDTEEQGSPEKAEPPKKKSSLPYTLTFCGLLVLVCGGAVALPMLMKERPPKNDSYSVYTKGQDLWFYNGKKREAVLVSAGTVPALDDPDSYYSHYGLKLIYDELVHYDAKQNLLWYPDQISPELLEEDTFDPGTKTCRLLCRNLKTSEETVVTDSLSLQPLADKMSARYTISGIPQTPPQDEYVNIHRPYLFLGDTIYYTDKEQHLMRAAGIGSEPETVAESVNRFWATEDGQSVLFFAAEEDTDGSEEGQNNLIIKTEDGQISGYGADGQKFEVSLEDGETPTIVYSADAAKQNGNLIRSSEMPEIQFEMTDIPHSFNRVKNGEQPQQICSGLNAWSIPQTASAFFVTYSVTDKDDGTCSLRRYQTATQRESTLFVKDNSDDSKWVIFSLCCYPNGDCYFACADQERLSITPVWYSAAIASGETHYTGPYSYISEPIRNATGVWFHDAEKNDSTFLFSPTESIQSYTGVGLCCRSMPYIIGSSGYQSTIFYRDHEHYKAQTMPKGTNSVAFSPGGNYLLCSTIDVNSNQLIMYTDVKKGGIDDQFHDLTQSTDGSAFITWYTDPDTGKESALVEEYPRPDDSVLTGEEPPQMLRPTLRAGSRVLNSADSAQGADAFGQIYALNNFSEYTYLSVSSGTLNRLDKDAWTPIAQKVKDYQSVSADSLYLTEGTVESGLRYLTGNRSYLLDQGVTNLLTAGNIAENS